MPAKKKPFRTIKDSYQTGRFSREEIRAAILAILRERGELPPARAGQLAPGEPADSAVDRSPAA